jgi:hypothetical protein
MVDTSIDEFVGPFAQLFIKSFESFIGGDFNEPVLELHFLFLFRVGLPAVLIVLRGQVGLLILEGEQLYLCGLVVLWRELGR